MLVLPTPFLVGVRRNWLEVFRAGEIDSAVRLNAYNTQLYSQVMAPKNGFHAPGRTVRVTFMGPSDMLPGAFKILNASIGKFVGGALPSGRTSSNGPNTVAPPVRLTFAGANGTADEIGVNGTVVSDAVPFSFVPTDTLVIRWDLDIVSGEATTMGACYDVPGCGVYVTGTYQKPSNNVMAQNVTTTFDLFDSSAGAYVDLVGIYRIEAIP